MDEKLNFIMANQKLRQEFKEAKKIVGAKNSQQSLAEEQRVTESKMEKERLCHNTNSSDQ